MHSLTSLLFLTYGLLALVAASPTGGPLQKRGVYKVERVPNPNAAPRNGPKALLKTLRKYRMPVPATLLNAVQQQEQMITKREPRRQKGMGNGITGFQSFGDAVSANSLGRQGGRGRKGGRKGKGKKGHGAGAGALPVKNTNGTGLVVAVPEANDVEYLSPVNIGGQNFNLDFDTGSSDLWVFSTQLSAATAKAAEQAGHSVFDATKSATFKELKGASFSIQYGDGSGAEGVVGTDVVNIGGAQVNAQAVELATGITQSFFDDVAVDGLLGLAFGNINTVQPKQQSTFFENLLPDLAEPVFTADLRAGANGAYEFGRVDNTKFTGDLTFIPIDNSQGFWQFTSDTFAVGDAATAKLQTSVAGNQAIADTGTTLLLADPAVADGYYAEVDGAVNDPNQGGFTVPCDAALPDLQLAVGDAVATVKGSNLIFAPVDAAGQTCFGGLQGGQSGGLQVYGDIFFKSNFVVFNGGNNTLGFATHV